MSFKQRVIETPRIKLNAREAGAGPVAIFMHGITAVGAVWDPVVERLQHTLRCIAIDQRGHGRSDKPPSDYGAEGFAHDLIALAETLGAGPVIAVGHSLGARNAIVAATLRPDLIHSVVAVDFTPFIETEVFDSLEARVNGGDREFASRDEIETYLQGRYPKMPPNAVARRATHAYAPSPGGFRPLADPRAMTQTAQGLRDDLEAATKAVARPTLLVRGAESKLVSEAAFERTRRLRPDLPTLVVPDTDHYVPEEAPGAIADAVLRMAAA